MGIRDFFSRRRERESALPPGTLVELGGGVEAEAEPGPPAADAEPVEPDEPRPESEPAHAIELPGSDAAALGELLRQAASTGLPQVSFESHSVEVEGTAGGDLAGEILAILGGAGAARGSPGGEATGPRALDPERVGDLREAVRDELRRQGIDPDSGEPL